MKAGIQSKQGQWHLFECHQAIMGYMMEGGQIGVMLADSADPECGYEVLVHSVAGMLESWETAEDDKYQLLEDLANHVMDYWRAVGGVGIQEKRMLE